MTRRLQTAALPRAAASARARAASRELLHDEEALQLSEALVFMRHLWRLNHALERTSSRMASSLGITAQQRMVLRYIGKYPNIGAGRLAQLLHLHPGTVSAALRRLEAKQLLIRTRDVNDKRRVRLLLTSQGRALDKPARGTVEYSVERLLHMVEARSLAMAVEVVATLTQLLEAELGKAVSTGSVGGRRS